MSLLNQVLQDLDARASGGGAAAALHTAAPSIVEHAAAEFELDRGGAKAVVWVMLGVVLVSAFAFLTWNSSSPALSALVIGGDSSRSPVPSSVAVDAAPLPQGIAAGPSTAQSPPAVEQVAVSDSPTELPTLVESTPELTAVKTSKPTPLAPADGMATSSAADLGDVGEDARYLALNNDRVADLPTPASSAREMGTSQSVIRRREPDSLSLARAAIANGELAEAEHLLQQQLQRKPEDRIARELLIGLMLRGDRPAQAMRQLDGGLHHHPGHATFVLIKARLLAEAGSTAQAIELLESGRGGSTDSVQERQMLAALYQKAGRYAEAAEQYRGLLEVTSGSATAWVGLAISLDALGDTGAALAYQRALKIGGLPSAADVYARRRVEELR